MVVFVARAPVATDDYRIFCGDLGNEVTDEVLGNAFRRLVTAFVVVAAVCVRGDVVGKL